MSGINGGHSLRCWLMGTKGPMYMEQCRLLGNGIRGNFYKRRDRKTKIWFITSYFFMVVLEFPFLDDFLTCVDLWKAHYDFQCFSLKLPTRFSIPLSPSDFILLEMLFVTLCLHRLNCMRWLGFGLWTTSISYIAPCFCKIMFSR